MRSVPVAVMPAARHILAAFAAAGVLAGAVLTGCSRNTLELVDTDLRRVPDAEPLVERIVLSEAYWWLTDNGIAVAGARGPVSSAGGTRQRVDLSFVFSGRPAAASRDYQLNTESLRAYVRQGPLHRRYRSGSGIAAVWLEPGGGLRVKFRVLARRETFHILTGWSAVGETMLLGEFRARPDDGHAAAIVERSEADGLGRSAEAQPPVDPQPRPVPVTGPALDGRTNAPPVREDRRER